MRFYLQQGPSGELVDYGLDEFLQNMGIFAPLIVDTREDQQILQGYVLVMGKEIEVVVDGVDKPKSDIPPTWVTIIR